MLKDSNENNYLPANFIDRIIKIKIENDKPSLSYSGTSTWNEFDSNSIWDNKWTNDIEKFGRELATFIQKHQNQQNKEFFPFLNKKIISIDIETTDFIPKAYEGFVNIIGISVLDFKTIENNFPNFYIYQIFNMKRKKEEAKHLLSALIPHLKNADLLIIFNKKFDLRILNTIKENFKISIEFPDKIFDAMDFFRNLKSLEDYLESKIGVSRELTEKGHYSDYYKLFKGRGSKGLNKKIEPIGSYNIIDTITPLFYYLINKIEKHKNKL